MTAPDCCPHQVGTIPICRSSALNPLYEQLPVLIVRDWTDVTPRLLRSFLVNYTIRKPFYRYEKLFADYWVGQVRCIANAASDGLGWPRMTSDDLG
jgi:hypothetical protein